MADLDQIKENVRRVMSEIPPDVTIVAATKGRTIEEISAALEAGITIIGENYIQETEAKLAAIEHAAMIKPVSPPPEWHFIGHLQLNKVKKAAAIFDMIETVDSRELAIAIDEHAALSGKVVPVLIEINSGREPQKNGVLPESVEELARFITGLPNLKLSGLMTMGPNIDNESLRRYFTETRDLFDRLQQEGLPGADFRYLSMGMSGSYQVAIEEGSNLVRLGTAIFGQRS